MSFVKIKYNTRGGANRGTSVGDIRLNGVGELQMLNGDKLLCAISLDCGNLLILYRLFVFS